MVMMARVPLILFISLHNGIGHVTLLFISLHNGYDSILFIPLHNGIGHVTLLFQEEKVQIGSKEA